MNCIFLALDACCIVTRLSFCWYVKVIVLKWSRSLSRGLASICSRIVAACSVNDMIVSVICCIDGR